MSPATILKIIDRHQLAEMMSTQVFKGSPADLADGFMHFSTQQQLPETLHRHYNGLTGLWVLHVVSGKLHDSLRWEPSRGGDLFPHLYGPLPLSTVIRIEPVMLDESTS